jgi:hypothetical protein
VLSLSGRILLVVAVSSIVDAGTITAASGAAIGTIGKRESPSARRPKLRPGPSGFCPELELPWFSRAVMLDAG